MVMSTRSEFLKQLDDIDGALGRFAAKTADDVRTLVPALAGDEAAIGEVLAGAKGERRLRGSIEDTCFDVMLLQQPIAGDLRFVSGVFRLVSDLTHIDEMSRDVAYLAKILPVEVSAHVKEHLDYAANQVAAMVEEAVEAFRTSDVDKAHDVFSMDDGVDDAYLACEGAVIDLIKASETRARYLPELLMVAKYFERMGDDAVRIADWAIFRATGARERSSNDE